MIYQPIGHFLFKLLLMVAFLAIVAWGLKSFVAGYSVFIGGSVACLANSWFIWRLLSVVGQQDSEKVLSQYHRAELGKIAIVTGCLVALFVYSKTQQQDDLILDIPMLMFGFVTTAVLSTVITSKLLQRLFSQQ